MQKNHFLLLKKLKNTESAQLKFFGFYITTIYSAQMHIIATCWIVRLWIPVNQLKLLVFNRRIIYWPRFRESI